MTDRPASPLGDPGPALRLREWTLRIGDPRLSWSWRVDGFIAASLALATLATRIPNRSRYLWGWDSVSFALALEEYDVLAQRPHAPGYPVYVGMAKVLYWIVRDANVALVTLSILLSVLAVILLYGFLRQFGSMRAALAGSILFLLAPVFVFNGIIALSYAGEAAASVGVAWLAWKARQTPSTRTMLWLGVAFGLGAGLRQSLLIFLSPLVAWALLGSPGSWVSFLKRGAYAGAAGAATVLAWFVPAVTSTSRGYAGWRDAASLQSEWVVLSESVFTRGLDALREHATRVRFYVHAEEAFVLPLLVALVAAAAVFTRQVSPGDIRRALAGPTRFLRFLMAWLLPSLLFYLLVFSGWDKGPTGYVLVLLPGLYALYAWLSDGALRLLERQAHWPPLRPVATLLALPLLLVPGVGLIGGWGEFLEREVQAHDEWSDAWGSLHETFPPNETAILTWYSWAHAKWYFPDYLVWGYFPIPRNQEPPDWELVLQTQHHLDDVLYYDAHAAGPGQPQHPIPPEIRTVIVFDFQLAGENQGVRRLLDEITVEEAFLPGGWRVLLFHPDSDHPTIESFLRPLT